MSAIKKHRKQLRLGMPVYALDGEAGVISKFITDPENHRPIYLGVKIGRLRHRREVVIPVSLVANVSAETVNLDVRREALEDFPAYEVTYRKGSYERPILVGAPRFRGAYTPPANRAYMALKQHPVPEGAVAVEKGMVIRDCAGQEVGKVEGVLLDQEEQQGKYIVFRRDHFSPLRLISADLVQEVSSAGVKLRIDWESIEKLPEYSESTARRWSAGRTRS